jgi:DNA-binding NarL/FixJ family response regulator
MRTVLDTAPDITVLAEGENGADALRLVGQHAPDVLVLDVNLPDISGLEVARRLCDQDTSTAILALTAHDNRETVFGLLECGAIGYVLKDEALEALANAVRAAAQGESWLSPSVANQVIQAALGRGADRQSRSSPEALSRSEHIADLTPRELEVLRLLAQGLDNAAIAQQLVVATRTVQNHVSNIYGKLGVASRAEAMLYAIRHGLVTVTQDGDTTDEP